MMLGMLQPSTSDAAGARPRRPVSIVAAAALVVALVAVGLSAVAILPVSYTHLTLPTIYSV